jgi:hypothetical protein
MDARESYRSAQSSSHHLPYADELQPWLNLTDAAALLDISSRTLRLAIDRREISADHPFADGFWVIRRDELDSKAAHLTASGPAHLCCTLSGSTSNRTMERLSRSLRQDGVMYVSFKNRDREWEQEGRFFNGYTEESFLDLLRKHEALVPISIWTTNDVRPGRVAEKWLNALLRKSSGRS